MKPIRTAQVRYEIFNLEGGLDLVTPTLSLKPGVARDASNFEISVTGGYTRIPGYERYDGRPSPSAATYGTVTLTTVVGVAVGNTITNSPGPASGVVIAISGNTLVYTKAVGTFSGGDTIKVGATPIGTVVGMSSFTANQLTQAQYVALAANVYRADIQVVPGSGPVRGVAYYNGSLYAWRNNAGGTALIMFKASAGGWTTVALGSEISFNTGAGTAIAVGNTVTGLTSGATGVVSAVVLESGTTWVGGSGRLIFSSTVGTFNASESLQVGGVTRATSTTTQTAITLAPGGRVQTVQGSLATGSSLRLYGCDGKNRGFEFNGTAYVPIRTGMSPDTPTNVAVHKNYLFFSFGPSVQNSGIGTPYVWSPVFGANELILPEDVTALQSLAGSSSTGALGIYTRSNTHVLYGTSLATWNLVSYNTGVGAANYSVQTLENAYALDDRGVVSMQTSLNFGNFDSSTLTLNIRPFIQARRNISTASALNHEKSQYRIFYGDGYGLYLTIVNGQMRGSMPVLFPDPVFCWCEGGSTTGNEISFYGGNAGYVYQMDTGTSFDGASISAYLVLNFDSIKSPRILKRYRRGSLEVTGGGYADFNFSYTIGYASPNWDQSSLTYYATPFTGAQWDSFIWDSFVWDGSTLSPSEVDVNGTAENIAVNIASNSAINQQFTINSVILHYSLRRGIR
jgi:hypothetical protein